MNILCALIFIPDIRLLHTVSGQTLVIKKAELSGRPKYPAGQTIRQAELSGRPNNLAGRTIWQTELSGRPNYPTGRTIWQAELSGRPNYLADRTSRQAELSGRPNCPAGRIRQVRLFGQPDMVSDLSLIPFFPSSILLYYLLVPLNFVILNFT